MRYLRNASIVLGDRNGTARDSGGDENIEAPDVEAGERLLVLHTPDTGASDGYVAGGSGRKYSVYAEARKLDIAIREGIMVVVLNMRGRYRMRTARGRTRRMCV